MPSNAKSGSGTSTVEFDDATHMMRVTATFSDLVLTGTGTTAAHIHILTPPELTGGVVAQVPSYPGFPLGVTSGVYDATFDMLLASSYNPAFLNNAVNGGDLATAECHSPGRSNAGNAYFNIHSSTFPGGEIRGTLLAVPEPSTWAMMLIGVGSHWLPDAASAPQGQLPRAVSITDILEGDGPPEHPGWVQNVTLS